MGINLRASVSAFLNTWGHDTIYFFSNAGTSTTGGTGREMTAVVNRQAAAGIREAPETLRPFFVVHVANDADGSLTGYVGISADEIDTGTALLSIQRKVGGTYEPFRIMRIRSQDEGMLALEVQ